MQTQHIDDLRGSFQSIFLKHSIPVENLVTWAEGFRLEDNAMVGDELCIILIGAHHKCFELSALVGKARHRTYHIVGFIVRNFDDGDTIGFDDLLDPRHGESDVLGRGLALCLVSRELLVAKRASFWIEAHGDTVGAKQPRLIEPSGIGIGHLLASQYILQGLGKTIDGRSNLSLAIHKRLVDEPVVCAKYQRVCIQKEQSFHNL